MIGQDDVNKAGLARELARMNLPANVYTQWYWKVDLHNLFHFLRLAAPTPTPNTKSASTPTSMCETCEADWVPGGVFGAFEDYRLGGANLSRAKGLACACAGC